VPPRDDLRSIGERIVDYFEHGGDPPHTLYVYPPAEEYQVRADLSDLRLWLESEDRRVHCEAVSLAKLFWQALDDQDWADTLIQEEEAAQGDSDALEELYASVGEILRELPTLPDRVLFELERVESERTAVFLYRAGALYPAYRTSALLEDLRNRLRMPVTLLYPGRIVGEQGLSFMGRCEPGYGYRATIVPRGDRQ